MLTNEISEVRVDPRIKRTRALIEQAFMDELSAKGFQSVSVQDITERAGVNRSTFYLHFTDKYELLDFSISQRFRQELEKRSLNLCHFTPENLQSLIITLADFILTSNAHCPSTDPQFEALVEVQVKRQIQSLLQVWVEKGKLGEDPLMIAIAGSWALYGLALEWSHTRVRSSVEEFAQKVSPILYAIMGLK
jgi:AcrR family transcriptional regulator